MSEDLPAGQDEGRQYDDMELFGPDVARWETQYGQGGTVVCLLPPILWRSQEATNQERSLPHISAPNYLSVTSCLLIVSLFLPLN